jgi:hypothetical protein
MDTRQIDANCIHTVTTRKAKLSDPLAAKIGIIRPENNNALTPRNFMKT